MDVPIFLDNFQTSGPQKGPKHLTNNLTTAICSAEGGGDKTGSPACDASDEKTLLRDFA